MYDTFLLQIFGTPVCFFSAVCCDYTTLLVRVVGSLCWRQSHQDVWIDLTIYIYFHIHWVRRVFQPIRVQATSQPWWGPTVQITKKNDKGKTNTVWLTRWGDCYGTHHAASPWRVPTEPDGRSFHFSLKGFILPGAVGPLVLRSSTTSFVSDLCLIL